MTTGIDLIATSEYDILLGKIEEDMLLSVVIPTYKRGKLLEDAIDSVVWQAEKYKSIQVIVLSNDPEDDMHALVDKYRKTRLCIVRNRENLGMRGNQNKCAVVAKSKYIAYLHDDDLLKDSYCESIVPLLNEVNDVDCFIPLRETIFPNDNWGKKMIAKKKIKDVFARSFCKRSIRNSLISRVLPKDVLLCGQNCFGAPTCGTIYRREAFLDVGGYSAEWQYAFDLMFYMKFAGRYKTTILRKNLGYYRMVQSASNNTKVQVEFFTALKCVLENSDSDVAKKYYWEYLQLFSDGLAVETQEKIKELYPEVKINCSLIKLAVLRMKTEMYSFRNGFYLAASSCS